MSISEGYDLSGKRIIVTGASSGIGKELSRVLVIRGAELIMACRNAQKTQAVINELATDLDADQAQRLVFEQCDLASMQSVYDFCTRLKEQGKPVDAIFMNGGVFAVPYGITSENLEVTYASNYLGHYLMLRALLNAKLLNNDSQIVGTMSEGGYQYPFASANFKMLEAPEKASAVEKFTARYTASPNSKVMLLLMMVHFNNKIKSSIAPSMRFNCGDPGPTLTDNINQMGTIPKLAAPLYAPWFMHSVERGAANLIWLATAGITKNVDNVLLNKRFDEVTLPRRSMDPDIAATCWQLSEKVIERVLGQPIDKICA